jgi:hypothetical protein
MPQFKDLDEAQMLELTPDTAKAPLAKREPAGQKTAPGIWG